jgi:hypothetical protein
MKSAVAPNIFATEDVSIGTGDRNARRVQSLQVLIIIRSYSAEILRLTLLFLINAAVRASANAKQARLALAVALICRQHEQRIGKCALRFAEINAVFGNVCGFFFSVPFESHVL